MNGLSFERVHKLTRRLEFTLCYDQGRKFFSKSFVLFVRERSDSISPWRFGMAITKKTGSAVKRNRLRRLIREYFRVYQKDIPNGCDIVVVPKRGVDPADMNFFLIAGELTEFIRKLVISKSHG